MQPPLLPPPAVGNRGRPAAVAAVGLVLVVVLLFATPSFVGGAAFNPAVSSLLSYLAAWVPLLSAVVVAMVLGGKASLKSYFSLSFSPLDILWGMGVGALVRAISEALELGVYGHEGSPALIFDPVVHDLWWVFASIAAPVIIGPCIEELFFRGLLLRALCDLAPRRDLAPRPTAVWVQVAAVAVSATAFALLHAIGAGSVQTAVVAGLSTLILGGVAAAFTLVTGRLGTAVVAHIVFNAIVVIPALF